jgi:hypothetical protein
MCKNNTISRRLLGPAGRTWTFSRYVSGASAYPLKVEPILSEVAYYAGNASSTLLITPSNQASSLLENE